MTIEHYSKYKYILLAIIVPLLLLGVFLLWQDSSKPEPITCSQEAKLCPDGSYIGRRGPDCLFPQCPPEAKQVEESNWYPPVLETEYISTQVWPPQISKSPKQGELSCPATEPSSSLPRRVSERTINGRDYCVEATSEGAAGSVFTKYKYTTYIGREITDLEFTLRFVNCQNFSEAEMKACQQERETFSIDNTISELATNLNDLRNFEDCQKAGFEVSGDNPPECHTPDGRIFPKRTNATWQELKSAIENCQAKQVFQAHSRESSVELKDGSTLTAIEPKIDDIIDLALESEDKCGRIPMATE